MLALAGTVVLVALTAVTRERRFLAGASSWVLFGAVATFVPWLPISTGTPVNGVTVAVANALAKNPDPEAAAADILALDADVVVVPEDSGAIHELLAEAYPFAHRDVRLRGFVGVYSRLPARLLPYPDGLIERHRYARVAIGGDRPFVLWALHLPRPWFTTEDTSQMRPRRHAEYLDRVIDAMAEETLPVVVAGDLNLTDRGRGYRRITRDLDDAMRSVNGRRTSLKTAFRPLLLRIDHILEPPDWCADRARRFRITGSDHRGVAARIGPCARR